jgi:cytochrome c oxidase subunit 4
MSSESGAHSHEPVHPRVYFITYVALLVLMFLTIGVYTWGESVHISAGVALILAMIIAVFKAVLVVFFFMQVKYSSRLTWLWAGLGFVWMFFLSGIVLDYVSRFYRMPDGKPF